MKLLKRCVLLQKCLNHQQNDMYLVTPHVTCLQRIILKINHDYNDLLHHHHTVAAIINCSTTAVTAHY